MNPASGRSIDVDFFRGLVLIVIALDHVTGSFLARFMLHAYAFCDSAEVFVCLGGYASAAAYCAVAAHRGDRAASLRFYRRSWEIYRAYLFTALLMLVCAAILATFNLNRAALDLIGWQRFVTQPWSELADIALFWHQPYLASVLPMYVVFALSVPCIVPLATRAPETAIAASALVWVLAPWLAHLAPVVRTNEWGFNPFAWQLVFVGGVLARLHRSPAGVSEPGTQRVMTVVALTGFVAFACARLFVFVEPMPGIMKQDLAFVRVLNFAALAWLAGQAVRAGHIRWLATRFSSVVTVGRSGLVCFVAGTVISIAVDTLTRHGQIGGIRGVVMALTGDAATVAWVIGVAILWQRMAVRVRSERLGSHARAAVRRMLRA